MRSHLALCVAALVLAFGSIAAAQVDGMVFRLDETGAGAPPPPADGPPSEVMLNALRLYQQGAYQEAAILFERVIEGAATEAPAATQKKAFGDQEPSVAPVTGELDRGPSRTSRASARRAARAPRAACRRAPRRGPA